MNTREQIDLTEAGQFVCDLIREGGRKLIELRQDKAALTTYSKGGLDYATSADDMLDAFLIQSLLEKYPNIPVLSEESAPEDYSSLKDEPNLWVVDPIDGTTNFKQGFPDFGIGIALVSKSKAKLGIVYLPVNDALYYAQRDKSATLNGKPITVSTTDTLSEALFCTDWAHGMNDRQTTLKWLGKILNHVRAIQSRGSAVATISAVADGKIDAYLQPGLKPWGVAAPSIIVQQAGGIVTASDGTEWDIFNPDILATNNRTLHEEILLLLQNIR